MDIRLAFICLALGVVGCGAASEQGSTLDIVGGEIARADDPVAKITVSLVKGRQSFCTGVVIAPRFVLTAAHCLESAPTGNFQVYFGLVARPDDIDDKLLVGVEEIKGHEDYKLRDVEVDPKTGLSNEPVHDIGLVELEKDALAAPAPFVSAHTTLQAGDPIVLAGFGKTAATGGESGALRLVETAFGAELTDSKEVEIQRGPLNSCDGDSGGPLYLKKNDGLYLLGILSRGDEECLSTGVYTDVRQFEDWIATSMDVMAKTKGKKPAPTAPLPPAPIGGPFVPPIF